MASATKPTVSAAALTATKMATAMSAAGERDRRDAADPE